MGDTEKIDLPKELVAEVREAAALEKRSLGDVLADAVRKYLDDRKWQNLVESGNRRAQRKGLTEEDVPSLVEESRRHRRR